MNSIREFLLSSDLRQLLGKSLEIEETKIIEGTECGEPAQAQIPKRIFDGPSFNGKQCAECERLFKSSSEYVTCRLCKVVVCRRKKTCKALHHSKHRVEFLKARQSVEVAK
jgi:hypothetical protein